MATAGQLQSTWNAEHMGDPRAGCAVAGVLAIRRVDVNQCGEGAARSRKGAAQSQCAVRVCHDALETTECMAYRMRLHNAMLGTCTYMHCHVLQITSYKHNFAAQKIIALIKEEVVSWLQALSDSDVRLTTAVQSAVFTLYDVDEDFTPCVSVSSVRSGRCPGDTHRFGGSPQSPQRSSRSIPFRKCRVGLQSSGSERTDEARSIMMHGPPRGCGTLNALSWNDPIKAATDQWAGGQAGGQLGKWGGYVGE